MQSAAHHARRIRRHEYERMIQAGLFQNERVELIRGTIVEVSPQDSPHAAAVQELTHLLVELLGRRVRVRVQLPLNVADDSVPEPDLAIVPPGDHRAEHPSSAFFVIEVADSSLKDDRTDKAALYAEAGIAEYWVVNLVDNLVEVHTDLVRGAYSRVTPFRKGESIRPRAFADVEIPVAAFLR